MRETTSVGGVLALPLAVVVVARFFVRVRYFAVGRGTARSLGQFKKIEPII